MATSGIPASGIGSLSTLIKRLEAATSRLEDITLSQASASTLAQPTSEASESIAPHLAAATAAGAAGGATGAATAGVNVAPAAAPEDPPAVVAWDETVTEALKAFTELSSKLGGLVQEQAAHVTAVFDAQRAVVATAAACAKPSGGVSSPVFAGILGPLQTALGAVTELREKNRADKAFFNHLSTVSEGIPASGWVAVEPKPGPYVAEMRDSAQFYANRVIKEHKDSDKTHVEWTRAYSKLLEELRSYVMKHHTTGLAWNPKGVDAATYTPPSAGSAAPAPPAPAPHAGGPPPPPPPPPVLTDFSTPSAASAPAAGDMSAVFQSLNQGENITKGLKKVDSSQMTHKNPQLRSAASAAAPPSPGGKAPPPKPGMKPASFRAKKPAKTELEGNKWSVEYHEENRSIVIEQTELNQTVNIFGCKNCTIQIKGKVNAVSMVSCTKTSVLLDSVVSSLSITSSPSFVAQILGRTPTVLLDTTDSGQLFLSSQGLDTEIITAKCSAINISTPLQGGEEGEFVEHALPEQMKHTIVGGKIKTEIVSHVG